MPVHRVGRDCWQWGSHGKVYCGKGAKQKAERHGRAAPTASGELRGTEQHEEVAAPRRVLKKVTPTRATLEALALVPDHVSARILADPYMLRYNNARARSIKRNMRGSTPQERARYLADLLIEEYEEYRRGQ